MKTTFTDTELESFLYDTESDRAERKQSYSSDARDKVRQTVCAFSNDFPGHNEPGIVFIGASDDDRPSGLSVTDALFVTTACRFTG